MTKKSAAELKLAKDPKTNEQRTRENWAQARSVELTIMETKLSNMHRVDNYMTMRDLRESYFEGEECTVAMVRGDIEFQANILSEVMEKFKALSFEDFGREDFEDPYQDLMADCGNEDEVGTWEDVYRELLKWQCIRPFGERLLNLNRLVAEGLQGGWNE